MTDHTTDRRIGNSAKKMCLQCQHIYDGAEHEHCPKCENESLEDFADE